MQELGYSKLKLTKSTPTNDQKKAVTAGNPTRAPWTEIVTQKMSYTRLKSPLQPRRKRTSDFVTLLLN